MDSAAAQTVCAVAQNQFSNRFSQFLQPDSPSNLLNPVVLVPDFHANNNFSH